MSFLFRCDRCFDLTSEIKVVRDELVCLPCLQNEAEAMIVLDIQRMSMMLTQAGFEFELVEVLYEDEKGMIVEVIK